MPANQRILAIYENRLGKLVADLIAENNPSEEDRAHLLLVAQLVQTLVKAYESHQLDRAVALEAARAAASISAPQQRPGSPDVSLRHLVDAHLMSPWCARFLNSSLGMKRTVMISGGPHVDKSTLLNALIDLLPRDHRIVAIDDTDEGLPALRDRAFATQLKAKGGTPARASVFRKAAEMKPTWLVTVELVRREGPTFLEALTESLSGGLTTIQTTDPEATLNDWLARSKLAAEHLKSLNPLVVHLEGEPGTSPRVERVIEVTTDNKGRLVVTPREQIESEPAGTPSLPGGERSESAPRS